MPISSMDLQHVQVYDPTCPSVSPREYIELGQSVQLFVFLWDFPGVMRLFGVACPLSSGAGFPVVD
jgi:hypothetical protein